MNKPIINNPFFWIIWLICIVIIKLMFTAKFWIILGYTIGYTLLFASAIFFVYVVFIRPILVNRK